MCIIIIFYAVVTKARISAELVVRLALIFAGGHTATNTPDLFRTPKLTVAGPGQYWGGGPPGKSFGCCRLFVQSSQSFCERDNKRVSQGIVHASDGDVDARE